jgi:hypothetical protein
MVKGEVFKKVADPSRFIGANIGKSRYAKLSSITKVDAEAFAYVVQAIDLLVPDTNIQPER